MARPGQQRRELTGQRALRRSELAVFEVTERGAHLARKVRGQLVAQQVGDRQTLELAHEAYGRWRLVSGERTADGAQLAKSIRTTVAARAGLTITGHFVGIGGLVRSA